MKTDATLREWLADGQGWGSRSGTIAAALSLPHCWPREGALRERAEHGGVRLRRGPQPGETLLVSVTDDGRAALWLIASGEGAQADVLSSAARVALTAEVSALLELARGLALSSVPVLDKVRLVPPPWCWSISRVWKMGSKPVDSLDGASFGLAMVLACASSLLDVPLRTDTCALAAIDAGGGLHAVDALAEKLAIVSGVALGVSRVLVHPEDVDEAQRVVAGEGLGLDIVPARTITDAFHQAFDDIAGRFDRLWSRPERRIASAESVFQMALRGENRLLRWDGVAAAAGRLAAVLDPNDPDEADARWKAATAELVARRHRFDPEVLIPWPDDDRLGRLPRPTRLKVIAHAVQSAADGPTGYERRYVARAEPFLTRGLEAHPGDVEVMGAIGRALAAVRDYAAARGALREALETWTQLGEINESSRALCEYLRVVGIEGDAGAVTEALERWFEPFDANPRTDHTSRAFVQLAAGRALVQAGRPEEAVRFLAEPPGVDWRRTPGHVAAGRLRWLARALAAAGRHAEAAARWRELDVAAESAPPWGPPDMEDNVLLSRLDRALRDGSDPVLFLGGLLASGARHEVTRTIRGLDDPNGQASRLAAEYRY
jgi:tetratricopeptide (TPR) repeat protein